MTTLWLIRHGQTSAEPGLAVGWLDVPLSSIGRQQAKLLANRMADIAIKAIYSSDLQRAIATANPLAKRHGLTVRICSELRELNFGQWEGRSLASLWQEYPKEAQQWGHDMHATPTALGESLTTLEQRVSTFVDSLSNEHDHIAVVAHKGSLAALYAQVMSTTYEEAWNIGWANADPVCVSLS